MKRTFAIACALALALTACSGGSSSSQKGGGMSQTPPDPSSSSSVLPGPIGSSSSLQGGDGTSSAQPGETQAATLYIGMDGQFQEYPLETGEEITPRLLVEEIAKLTGWNLDLADEIASGKGGMTVLFGETSALFAGPPDPQKEEFHVFDSFQLDRTILDSIQKTLQTWAVVPGLGDPDSVDIYFCGPDGGDLVLENLGVTIPHTEPYQGFPNP